MHMPYIFHRIFKWFIMQLASEMHSTLPLAEEKRGQEAGEFAGAKEWHAQLPADSS